MDPDKHLADFPSVQAKLHKPVKQSIFEKQKAEAEAKRKREAAETAAVYEDFVKSFDDDKHDARTGAMGRSMGSSSHDLGTQRQRHGLGGVPPSGPGASKRHFGSQPGLKSGPGSLGPPPSSFGHKRSYQDFSRGSRDRLECSNDRNDGGSRTVSMAFNTSDDEDMSGTVDRAQEKAIARPTLRLTNLPPGTSPSVIKVMMPENLVVEKIDIQSSVAATTTERKSMIAIVVLSQETPANDMEAAVSLLQNRYMGYGHYLSINRHLSSAVSNSANLPHLGSSTSDSHPFGAKPVEKDLEAGNLSSKGHRSFAPPSAYGPPNTMSRSNLLHVPVQPPNDIKTLQLINKVIEGVLGHGPEFEALLMSRLEVQREEKWAWIWDARSQGGIWYRWRLWEITTGAGNKGAKGKFVPLFEGSHAWKTPEKNLPFEYATNINEFVSDSEYNSSDDEDWEGEANRENTDRETEKNFLNPLEKAKLAHLLRRLPTTLTKLRKGDIARVTAFAMMHASRGVDEVVEMIVSNVEKPFSSPKLRTMRNADNNKALATAESALSDGVDPSTAALIALYVVSDVLSSSSTSGVRHAWRFRQLFETSLRDKNVFENLGMMADKLGWGRMRADKWKRSINFILNLWEGWCVFPVESQELFSSTFNNPPSLHSDKEVEEARVKGKWKSVEKTEGAELKRPPLRPSAIENQHDEDERIGSDVVGEPIDEDEIEGEPILDDDIEGEPILDDEIEGEPILDDDMQMENNQNSKDSTPNEGETGERATPDRELGASELLPRTTGIPRKPRMRAADMFMD